jgi:hypothetical protein
MAAEAIAQALGILSAAAPVVALVGTRISPLIRAQDLVLPAVTLQRITLTPSNTFAGNGGLDNTRLQVDCWDATYAGARALAIVVRAAFDAVPVLMTLELDNNFQLDPVPGVYQITQEYQIWS